MTTDRDQDYLAGLVRELCKLPRETEWVEFKVNNSDPQAIGEYVSALANAAALNGKAFAYLVWGVEDAAHNIVGTDFSPSGAKKGNEPLETWLLRLLTPKIHFCFLELTVDGRKVVVCRRPRVSADDVLRLLDYPAYFDLLQQPLPANRDGIVATLAEDRLIRRSQADGWDITNLGAVLFAKKLNDFPALKRKAIRVIQYRGAGRIETLKEQVGAKGYANGFEGLIGYINGLLPSNEIIEQALRKTVPMFPELAVRELVANALIHQDLFVTGAGPMVEIFEDRIEITNPGEPLVDTQRFLDTLPKSRNEVLASLMRRFRICEERGSGIDKVVFQVELFQLPAPLFEVPKGFTRAVLFAHKPLAAMDRADRVRACYLHACLKYVTRGYLTNTSLRERFGVAEKNKAAMSRYIRESVEAGMIRPFEPGAADKLMKYKPFWA